MERTKNIQKVYIKDKENNYQNYLLSNILGNETYRTITMDIRDKELKNYFQNGLQLDTLVLYITVPEINKDLLEKLKKIKLKKRYLILEVEKPFVEKVLNKTVIDGQKPKIMPKFETWLEKENMCLDILEKTKTKFENVDVQVNLAKLMVRYEDLWSDIFLTLDLAKSIHIEVNLNYLQEIYPELEFYNLNDWLDMVITGKHKKKTSEIAHYFMETKKYHPSWLMRKLKERTVNLGVVYQAYRKGIIYIDGENADKLRERGNFLKWDLTETLANLKTFEINKLLRVSKEIPYKQYIKAQKIIYTYEDHNLDKQDIYKCILELLILKESVIEIENKQRL